MELPKLPYPGYTLPAPLSTDYNFNPFAAQPQVTNAPTSTVPSLASDPGVLMAMNQLTSGNTQTDAALQALRERALIAYGDPNIANVGFDVSPALKAQIQANYDTGNATLARLSHSNDLARQAVINGLSAHGILQSGDLGFREGEQQRAYANQQYDARSQLIDVLTNAAQNALDRKNALQSGLNQAYLNAYQNAANNPGAAGTISASQGVDASGKPTYQITANGATYNFGANGKPAWALVRNASSLPGNTAPTGVAGGTMYNADDPTLAQNLTLAKLTGQQAGVWIVPHAGETAAELGARAADLSKQYGVQVMFDSELSSKGYPGSPQYQYTQDFVNAYKQAGGQQFSVTVQGGGEDDYNYKAVADAGGMIWIQCYGADPGTDQIDPQLAVQKMLARGVPASQIGVMLAPGQSAPPGVQWSLYTIDDMPKTGTAQTQPQTQQQVPSSSGLQAALQNALSSGNYTPDTQQAIAAAVTQAYNNPVITTGTAARLGSAGME